MESPLLESKSASNGTKPQRSGSASSSNQLFIPDTLELPDDTFRMSLDNYSFVGENVTIGEKDVCSSTSTPVISLPTPNTITPNTPMTPARENSPPIVETPKHEKMSALECRESSDLIKLSLTNRNEMDDKFVKPSSVADTIMSPAKMLQFEMVNLTCSTPTMKRAAIDFDFFNKNKYEEYFKDVPAIDAESNKNKLEDSKDFEETPVIVKTEDTVRHEIGYGKQNPCKSSININ